MKKPLVTLAVVLIGMFSGGIALALTADHPATPPQSTELSDQSNSSDVSDTESTDTESESSDTESSDSTSSDSTSSDSTSSDNLGTLSTDSSSDHGAAVSSAAHSCQHGPHGVHGQCVSAVAHG